MPRRRYGMVNGAIIPREGDEFSYEIEDGEKLFVVTHKDGTRDLYRQKPDTSLEHIRREVK